MPLSWRINKFIELLQIRAARKLPYWLRYWVVIHAGVDATTGKYGHQEVPAVTLPQILARMK